MKEDDFAVFKPSDFKAIRLFSGAGEVIYFGSPTEEVRERMAQASNITLGHIVGVSKRFTKEEWADLWEVWQAWGQEMEEADSELEEKS